MIDNAQKAAARAEYERQRGEVEKIDLSDIARKSGVNRSTLKSWIRKEAWGSAPPQNRGAPKGNHNARGNRGGAPKGNKNAEKDGAYSAVDLNALTDEERRMLELMPADVLSNLRLELQVLRIQEKHLFEEELAYWSEDENTLHLSRLVDMRKPDGTGGTTQSMGMYSSDTAFTRALAVGDMLNKVQGRIISTIKSIIAIEESDRRFELERQRLEIIRNRAAGIIDIELDELE